MKTKVTFEFDYEIDGDIDDTLVDDIMQNISYSYSHEPNGQILINSIEVEEIK